MEQIDLTDTLTLCKMARRTIVDVMQRFADKGEPGRWRKLKGMEHLAHAHEHIAHPHLCIESDGLNLGVRCEKEDIEHALVRLTMALATMEKEYEQQSRL